MKNKLLVKFLKNKSIEYKLLYYSIILKLTHKLYIVNYFLNLNSIYLYIK